MEVVYFLRIQFDGKWTISLIDPAKQVFQYSGAGTIRVLRELNASVLSTYEYVVEDARVFVIAQDRVIHVPGKAKVTPGEVFP